MLLLPSQLLVALHPANANHHTKSKQIIFTEEEYFLFHALGKFLILTFTHTILKVSIVPRPKILVTGIFEILDSQSTLTNPAHLGSCVIVLFVGRTTGECTVGDRTTHKFAVGATVTRPAFAWSEFGGKVLAICTDTEHYEGKLDEEVLALADQADAMIYDSAYTDDEYPKFKGWGHSTWQEALKIAEAANVKNTFLFHHDPSHNDERMDEIAQEAAAINSSARPAVEGEVITL